MKGTSGLLALDDKMVRSAEESACIRCGKCVMVCPMGLLPYLLGDYAEHERFEDAEKTHVLDCIECGSCAYVCPANRHLVQEMRLAKTQIMQKRKK
jgi:electron transport complex protein RnfC